MAGSKVGGIKSSTNVHGFVGVVYNEDLDNYVAQIFHEGVRYRSHSVATAEEASEIYKAGKADIPVFIKQVNDRKKKKKQVADANKRKVEQRKARSIAKKELALQVQADAIKLENANKVAINKRRVEKTNKHGYPGVAYNGTIGKYLAKLSVGGRVYSSHHVNTAKEAGQIYQKAIKDPQAFIDGLNKQAEARAVQAEIRKQQVIARRETEKLNELVRLQTKQARLEAQQRDNNAKEKSLTKSLPVLKKSEHYKYGYPGVFFNPVSARYLTKIRYKGVDYHSYPFDTALEAAQLYQRGKADPEWYIAEVTSKKRVYNKSK